VSPHGCTDLSVRRLASFALQYVRFGLVGSAATAVHVVLFAVFFDALSMPSLQANLIAFTFAFFVSFFGHFHFTFRAGRVPEAEPRLTRRRAMARFLAVAMFGLLLNSAVVWLIVERLAWSYVYALILMATVVPVTVFALSRFWAFR
jgi:putative flippase GtrA